MLTGKNSYTMTYKIIKNSNFWLPNWHLFYHYVIQAINFTKFSHEVVMIEQLATLGISCNALDPCNFLLLTPLQIIVATVSTIIYHQI